MKAFTYQRADSAAQAAAAAAKPGAKFIAGRRTKPGHDEGLSPANVKAMMRRLGINFNEEPDNVFPKGIPGFVWSYDSRGKRHRDIFVNRDVVLPKRNMVTAHEFSHAIDDFLGKLSNTLTPDEISELRFVYGTLRSGSEEFTFFHQPEKDYLPHQVNSELLAEGIRAYMADPNYFKTVAPRTATRIRAAVNENLILRRVIQFNSLLAAGLIGAGVRNRTAKDE